MERVGDAAISLSTSGSIIHANKAAHSLAARLNPAHPELAHLVSLVPMAAVAGARADGVWKGPTTVEHLGIELDLELQTTERGSTAIFRQRSFETEQAAQSEIQLRHADRLATLGQLAAGVAHEVNNPISYAQSNLRVLEDYAENLLRLVHAASAAVEATGNAEAIAAIAKQREESELDFISQDLPKLLGESRSGLQQVGALMSDLRGFARENTGQAVPADLGDAVESSLAIVTSFLKFKAEIRREYTPVPLVECRVEQIKQVIVNLLMNAGQAIDRYGTITVSTGATDDEAWIGVADTGAGIPPERLARIFDPYFTTKPLGQGTGIGLAISYSIVAGHRGRIEVSSRVGEGTSFRIVLPLSQRLEQRPQAA